MIEYIYKQIEKQTNKQINSLINGDKTDGSKV